MWWGSIFWIFHLGLFSSSFCELMWRRVAAVCNVLYSHVLVCCYSSCVWIVIFWILLLWFLFGMSEGKSPSSSLDSEALLYFKLSGIRSLKIKSSESIGGRNKKYRWYSSHFECAGTYIRGVALILCEFQCHSGLIFQPIGISLSMFIWSYH